MLRSALYRFIILSFLIGSAYGVQAQAPQLPDIIAASDKGVNVLSWDCQYEGLKSIAVQRSSDSVFNYKTVGFVKNLKKGQQAFIDGHPQAGNNWYRLYIAFSSDLTWYSNTIKVYIDSATLLAKSVIPPNDSLQKYASSVQISPEDVIASSTAPPPSSPAAAAAANNANSAPTTVIAGRTVATNITNNNTAAPKPKLNLNLPKDEDVNQFTYIKSKHVFTNPFTGHVALELPDDLREPYAIKFFKQGDERTPVLDIPRIRKTKVIIDKHNFQGKGVYKFILFKGPNKLEEGYISIF